MFLSFQLNVERRLFTFRFGDPQARMNWVHVDNLVTAHLLAAEGLTTRRNHISVSQRSSLRSYKEVTSRFAVWASVHVAQSDFSPPRLCVLLQSGQVYFINDGVSVNVFEWLTPLVSLTGCFHSKVSYRVEMLHV